MAPVTSKRPSSRSDGTQPNYGAQSATDRKVARLVNCLTAAGLAIFVGGLIASGYSFNWKVFAGTTLGGLGLMGIAKVIADDFGPGRR